MATCLGLTGVAHADDAGSLQFTVPAPDPVQAGEVLSFQALAINAGASAWPAGSYYWVAEIFDLDFNLVARTDQVTQPTAVAPGGVASISLPFNVPETLSGRYLYRIYLIKGSKTLIQSEYKGFQVVAKPIVTAPPIPTYAFSGNIVQSIKAPTTDHGNDVNGATTINATGKVKDTSYLFNTYLLHVKGNVVNVYTIAADVYAPWGTIHAGDVIPHLGTLAVDGQGMRGGILEQSKDRFNWAVAGGQTVTSQAGTQTTDGRFARTLYGGKFGIDLPGNLQTHVNYFLSSDETGSLSSDPNSPNFKGPNLTAQKNSGYGLDLSWTPIPKLKFIGAYQKNQYWANVNQPGVSDKAWRGEIDWERRVFKLVTYVQRTGANFVSFGAPGVIGDRMSEDANFALYPVAWYKLMLTADQYKDNLNSNPQQVTTTQRVATMQHNFQFKTGTSLNLNGSYNSALGNPSSSLNNKTIVAGLGVTQAIKSQNVGLNVQQSTFRDQTGLSHGLNTDIIGLTYNAALPRQIRGTLGVNDSESKDIVDGSKRSNQTISPSVTIPISKVWTAQIWGTYTKSKSTSPTFPADSTDKAVNSEFTWSEKKNFSVTLGVGGNWNKDKTTPSNDQNAMTLSARYSYSF